MPSNPFKPLGEWLLKFYERLPKPVKAPFALVFVLLFVFLWLIPAGSWFTNSPALMPVVWVIGGLVILCTVAAVVFYFVFQDDTDLTDADKAIFRKLIKLLKGEIASRQANYLPQALDVSNERLQELFKRLAR